MSKETKEAVEKAIEAHIAEEMGGAFMTGYFLIVSGADMDRPGSTAYFYESPDTQPFHDSAGLCWMGNQYLSDDYSRGDRE